MTLDAFKNKVKYLKESEQKQVLDACEFAQKIHDKQKRKTGEDYISHCLETASFIADLKLDASTIKAAILHDAVEDAQIPLKEIQKKYGKTVAYLVDGVTKLGRIRITKRWYILKNKEELAEFDRQIETLRKMFIAMAKDIRVIIIKLGDRLHNMKTLQGVASEKRLRIAKETLEIYAPLAYRLGMSDLKGDLEDLAFPYIYPDEYKWIKSQIKDELPKGEKYLKKVKKNLRQKLAQEGIKAEVHGRAKHWYSLWRKLQRYDSDLSRIYDLIALRVVVGSVSDCYKVLGIIHKEWKPLVGRIKDYVAQPKPNGYQSLHTTVFCLEGRIVEFQIRTQAMHEQTEKGIAAGWHYAETKGTLNYILRKIKRVPQEDLRWVKELAKWQNYWHDNRRFTDELQVDFFSDRIFVNTPQGDVKDLPAGSTPIDFAYAIHSEIGDACSGAKVNGKLVNLGTPLRNGDIVEIIKAKKTTGPKRDWLEFAKTSLARSHIKRGLRSIKV